jgi:hypothetical protein
MIVAQPASIRLDLGRIGSWLAGRLTVAIAGMGVKLERHSDADVEIDDSTDHRRG